MNEDNKREQMKIIRENKASKLKFSKRLPSCSDSIRKHCVAL